MNEERRRVLDLLAEGKINADEAERLLNALNAGAREDNEEGGPFEGWRRMRRHIHRMHRAHDGAGRSAQGGERRYIRIVVDHETPEGRKERVRMKVPVKLLKAGISLSGLMPRNVREHVQAALKQKGIEVDPFSLRGADADEIAAALADIDIDIGTSGDKVRIYTVDDDDGDGNDDGIVREHTVRREFRGGGEKL